MDSIVVNRTDLSGREECLRSVASQTLKDLRHIVNDESGGLALLSRLKFDAVGRDPLKGTPLNFIEQLNQTFTVLASIKAAQHVFVKHGEAHTIKMNLGTRSGSDLEILDAKKQKIGIAEVFATVDPANNGKLRSDIKKVRDTEDSTLCFIRSVYFLSPNFPLSRRYKDSHNGKVKWFEFHEGEMILSDGLFVKIFQ